MPETPGSPEWRAMARRHLLDFAERSWLDGGGFGWLDDGGVVDPDRPPELWINARMTYVFSLATLLGDDRSEVAAHGVDALATLFHDDVNGGWFAETRATTKLATTKRCYEHSFVLLAACAARAVDIDGAQPLLDEALEVHGKHFWDEAHGRCVEEWDRNWLTVDPYRGANSNMHTVEAYLFAADITGDDVWRGRAHSICDRLINTVARSNCWRVPEHFDAGWMPLPHYNIDRPDDPFRPYGATPGHGLEWARLLVQLAASLSGSALPKPEPWLLDAAERLFDRAVADGVRGDVPGICYTTDWDGRPVVAERFHWVMAEAILAADALARATGRSRYRDFADRWWREVDTYFADSASGSWHHELSPTMGPSAHTWSGQPDAFHIFNAVTMPDLPLAPTAVLSSAKEGR